MEYTLKKKCFKNKYLSLKGGNPNNLNLYLTFKNDNNRTFIFVYFDAIEYIDQNGIIKDYTISITVPQLKINVDDLNMEKEELLFNYLIKQLISETNRNLIEKEFMSNLDEIQIIEQNSENIYIEIGEGLFDVFFKEIKYYFTGKYLFLNIDFLKESTLDGLIKNSYIFRDRRPPEILKLGILNNNTLYTSNIIGRENNLEYSNIFTGEKYPIQDLLELENFEFIQEKLEVREDRWMRRLLGEDGLFGQNRQVEDFFYLKYLKYKKKYFKEMYGGFISMGRHTGTISATALLLCTRIPNPYTGELEKHVLLTLNKTYSKRGNNRYFFSTPGGLVDKTDKNNFQALRREYNEEMGSELPRIDSLKSHDFDVGSRSEFVIRVYYGYCDSNEIKYDLSNVKNSETYGYILYPLEQFKDILSDNQPNNTTLIQLRSSVKETSKFLIVDSGIFD